VEELHIERAGRRYAAEASFRESTSTDVAIRRRVFRRNPDVSDPMNNDIRNIALPHVRCFVAATPHLVQASSVGPAGHPQHPVGPQTAGDLGGDVDAPPPAGW